MDPVVVTGLFTLGGVAAGSLLGPAGAAWLERQRADREVRAASRMLVVELFPAALAVDQALKVRSFDGLRATSYSFDRYDEHEPTFASTLATIDYLRLDGAVRELRLMSEVWHNRVETGRDLALVEGEAERFTDAANQCIASAVLLLDVARDGPSPSPLRRIYRKLSPRTDASREAEAKRISEAISYGLARVGPDEPG